MRNKKILLIVLPILLIAIIAVTVAVLYFTTDVFQSAEQLFWKNFASAGQALDLLSNENSKVQQEFKNANTYTSEGNITISSQIGEQVAQNINLVTVGKHDANTGRTYVEATLKNENADILKGTYINSGDIYAVKCDDILPNYVGVRNSNLKDVAKILGTSDEIGNIMPDSINFGLFSSLYTFTDTEKQHILETYSKVITETVGSNKYKKEGKEQIIVDGTSYSANKYTLTLNSEEVKQIIIKCLSKLKEDSATLVSISNRLSVLGMNEDYTDITNLATRIDEMAMNVQNATIQNGITISTYTYKGNAIKNVIDVSNLGKATIDINNTTNSNKAIISLEKYENTQETSIDINNNQTAINNEIVNEPINNYVNETNSISDISNNVEAVNMTVTGVQTVTNEMSQQTNIGTGAQATEVNNKTMQITISKVTSQNSITNTIEIIPDLLKSTQTLSYTANLGNVQNNSIINSYSCSIYDSSENTNNNIDINYNDTITVAEQVDEIVELTNSNAVIINNYKKEQIIPFIQALYQKATQVLTNKIQMVGVNTAGTTQGIQENGGANTTQNSQTNTIQ